ncbi:endonuclease MutS2 [Paenibacillus flagellatus]|uniref:DNA mismatch repair protein MutS n=1 Tax=Paenibacillus flagellatus TaxID=2211139 RepID=A0A2V5KQG5_9BACL|nr:DNA mismatch repair protein MutS [Paenibacillus flagellatus]PYI53567.1 DNA mismatch repair protein MutS [Paenibacillus flagellatus]
MNEWTLQRLEYDKVIRSVAEYAVSYLGKRHVEEMRPMTAVRAVRGALDETADAVAILNGGASVPIPSLSGIETVLQLAGTGYVFGEQDFVNVRTFLHGCAQLKTYMAAKSAAAPRVSAYAASLYELAELKSEIDRCIHNGQVADAASKELSKVRKKAAVVAERIKTRMDGLMSRHRAILQENLYSVRSGRYVLPVKKEHRKLVSGSVLDESASGQTVYIEPQEIAHLQFELADLRAEEAREEAKVLAELTGLLEEHDRELRLNVETVGTYDFVFAKAKYAFSIRGRNVALNDAGIIRLRGAKHPLLGPGTTPLDFAIGDGYSSLIITGPNTGGKTVALKTVGLLTLMAQSGLPVPVEDGSELAVYANVAADIGDGQSIEQSLSTFSAHIRNIIGILKIADRSTLVLLDEMASGTDPGEGVGLSVAILEELHRRGATVVATTHFNEIKHFASVTPGFENARMEFDAETLRPLYRLCIGEAGRSYAFLIALKLGMSPDIVRRSEELLASRQGESTFRLPAPPPPPQSPSQSPDAGKRRGGPSSRAIGGNEDRTESGDNVPVKPFEVGDSVYVSYLGRTGIVYEAEDARGNVGVMIQKQRLKINKKRLKLHIAKEELYPDDYDFDIVFETKENRKKKKLMSKRHVEGVTIVRKPDE